MSPQEAKSIIEQLARGVDPESGKALSGQSTFNSPQIIQALFIAAEALGGTVKGAKQQQSPPSNAGRSWTDEENNRLLAMFDSGASIKEIAAEHGRSHGAIRSRLMRFGRLDDRGNTITNISDFHPDNSTQNINDAPPATRNGSIDSRIPETATVAADATNYNQYLLFEKLMERYQEICSFLVQIGPIPKVSELYIFGDGSWGKLIEHNDAIKANQSAIQRVGDILYEWISGYAESIGSRDLDNLAHRFNIRLKANPNCIFKLFSRISRQPDQELIDLLREFSTTPVTA